MIKVFVISTSNQERLTNISVEGHAKFDEPGKDIVCSAVSALTIGAINSVEKLLKIDLNPDQEEQKGGYLAWKIPQLDDYSTDEKLQLLMKALVESLLMIEDEYKKFIQVEIKPS